MSDLSRGLGRREVLAAAALVAAAGLATGEAKAAQGLPGKGRLAPAMQAHVASGRLPGFVSVVARGGEAEVASGGSFAFNGGAPMARDTIFRIASVTKPITAVAAMMLVEECRLRLDEPVDEWLPELAGRQVLRSLEGPVEDTVPAVRPITLRDLLTFRSGHGAVMVFPSVHPIQFAMEEAGVAPGPMMPAFPPDEYMRRIGSLPLIHQPGEKWLYNTGSDILGVLIARAAGTTLGEFMAERIFAPLGMKDTGFFVPEAKLHRLPELYYTDFSSGEPVLFDPAAGGRFAAPPAFESGAGGLVSTADDLLAFARMMLAEGEGPSGHLLSRASVRLMTADHITAAQKAASPFFPGFWDSRGWGFGVSVITRRDDLAGTPGRYGWDGGYGTSMYMDPVEGLAGILLTQRVWDSPAAPRELTDFWISAYVAAG